MTIVDICNHCDHLTATIEAAHERALVALTTSDAGGFDAVAWLSAHLAAVEHVIEPMLDRHVPRPDAQRRDDRQVNHQMQMLLRALEQRAAGDLHAPRGDVARMRGRLVALLAQHAAAEHLLVDRLARVVGAGEAAALAARYEKAITHGPTRPHPHAPHGPVLERLAFTFDRVRDRVMDVLDARHVPVRAPRRPPRARGKWGSYLLGSMHPDE